MIQADSSVKGERKTIHYAYDALGRRTVRQEAGISGQRTVYDAFSFDEARSLALSADGSIMPESGKKTGGSVTGGKYRYEGPTTDGSSAQGMKYQATRNSIYVNSIPAAYKSSDGVFYSGSDRLGSTETITDEEGLIFESYEYDAFGGLISGNPEKGSGKLYAGKSYDPVTKTYDYGFRDYLPSLARFTTVDPIRDGANWYVYCNADPVNYVDLWGLYVPRDVPRADTQTVTYSWPVENGFVSSAYGNRDPGASPNPHPGIDVAGNRGEPILAAADGKVVAVDVSPGGSNRVIIEHDNGYKSYYVHCENDTSLLGKRVEKGQQIAKMSDSNTDEVHLHFEIRPPNAKSQEDAFDPIPLLPERPSSITLGPNVIESNGSLANKGYCKGSGK